MPLPKLKFRLPLGPWKLGPREKGWTLLWVVVVTALAYGRFIYKPRALAVRETVGQATALKQQKGYLESKRPDLPKRQRQIESLKEAIATRYEELTALEEKLLDEQDVDELLESLVKDRRKFELVLNTIRPITQQEATAAEAKSPKVEQRQGPYRDLLVQLDLYGTFQGLVSYVDFLEKMRPYQEVRGIKVKVEGKEVSRPHGVVLLSSLMGATLKEKEERRKEVFALLEEAAAREQKDPFLTKERPKEVVQAVGLELTGIFSEAGRPVAAIINNEIYRVGQIIQGKRIVSIEPNRVLLEQGNRRFILNPTQKTEGAQ